MGTSDYFDEEFFEEQKVKLLKLKAELLNNIRSKSNEDLHVPSDQIIEDGDQAQTYLDQNVSFGLRARELGRLREVELALLKIEKGTYGICEENDGPIEKKRLEKMPWARLSIEAAEEMERESSHLKKVR